MGYDQDIEIKADPYSEYVQDLENYSMLQLPSLSSKCSNITALRFSFGPSAFVAQLESLIAGFGSMLRFLSDINCNFSSESIQRFEMLALI